MIPGALIGPYEVIAVLGAGAMGEVYRARDTRLGRDVAIKALPEAFALDAQRRARFAREAHVLASLNHPNIATLYGVEESPGGQVLVMELVEGDTLADRLALSPGGRLPVPDALTIARQVAAALEAAHEHGIIHRDLKPANIAVRNDGTVKVLDFGLAKPESPASGPGHSTVTETALSSEQHGPGTPAYMSPEQARGLPVDRRTDMWAFGCVLFEMLTGTRPFEGEHRSDIIAKILERAPDLGALPPSCPAPVRRLVARCLEKNPEDRLRSAGDAGLEIRDAFSGSAVLHADRSRRERIGIRSWLAWMAYAAIVAAAVIAGWVAAGRHTPPPQRTVLGTIAGPELSEVDIGEGDRLLTITRDGRRVVFAGNHGTQIFSRALDELKPAPLTSPSLGVRGLFSSPDSRWIGYIDGNFTLKAVPISGGPPVTVATLDGASRGAAWITDDEIVAGSSNTATGLQVLSRLGGDPRVLTRPDAAAGELDHVFPEPLPGGRSVLMTVLPMSGRIDDAKVAVVDVETGAWTAVLTAAYSARYVPGGHLVYVARGRLQAVRFDLQARRVLGTPQPVLDLPDVTGAPYGVAHFDVADDGTLAYLMAERAAAGRTAVWVSPNGLETPVAGLPVRNYSVPRISPDGTRVAVYIRDAERDLWIWDLHRSSANAEGRETRLTFGPDIDSWPVWLSDDQIMFGSLRASGLGRVYLHRADGLGTPRQISLEEAARAPLSAVPRASAVVVSEFPGPGSNRGWELSLLSSSRGADGQERWEQRPLEGLNSRFNERNGTVSPDGRWIAYESDSVGGRFEVFVRPFPDVGAGVWTISTGGGQQPAWSRDGRELFYLSLDGTMRAAAVHPRDTSFDWGPPAVLFRGDYVLSSAGNVARHYDVAPDGRFLMLKDGGTTRNAVNQIVIVPDWAEVVKRMVGSASGLR